tara:strand:- start:14 stop:748 length:735 start_codon:yes stop_codon:yes gene_type:complete
MQQKEDNNMSKKATIVFACMITLPVVGLLIKNHITQEQSGEPKAQVVEQSDLEQKAKNTEIKFVEGEHYIKIDPVYGLPSNSVVEVLWYGCPHCYNMEEKVSSKEFKEKSKDWNFQQIHFAKKDGPVGFDFRIYAALKQMGLDSTIGKKYMAALHEDGLDRGSFDSFAKKNGLSVDAIQELSSNEEAQNYYNFSAQFSEREGFKGVPSFIVEGKYIINNAYDVADVANYLLKLEGGSSEDDTQK